MKQGHIVDFANIVINVDIYYFMLNNLLTCIFQALLACCWITWKNDLLCWLALGLGMCQKKNYGFVTVIFFFYEVVRVIIFISKSYGSVKITAFKKFGTY